NILDRFNPCARQLITAGKSYLKALHGSVEASKAYIDTIRKLGRQAQFGTWGGYTDIGTALMQLVDVQKEMQNQQLNIVIKSFYVDLLVPLETNLEKDTKVVLSEQKKFQHSYKNHHEAYLKAAASVKKHKKKNRSSRGSNLDKEIKHIHALEEEKLQLEGFCDTSLKQAITQERRRYGFVLERQCSLMKHYLAFHQKGQTLLQHYLTEWQEVVNTREKLPKSIEKMFSSDIDVEIGNEYACSNILIRFQADQEDRMSCTSRTSRLRKTRSIDSSCLDIRELHDDPYPTPLSRTKSDVNLTSSSASLHNNDYGSPQSSRRLLGTEDIQSGRQEVQAIYSYLSSGEHQLSFHEGDILVLIGQRNKGWQYGENLRNHRCGWFPVAYTTPVCDRSDTSSSSEGKRRASDFYTGVTSREEVSNNVPCTRPFSSSTMHSGKEVGSPPPAVSSGMSTFGEGFYCKLTEMCKTPTASNFPENRDGLHVAQYEGLTLRPICRSLTSPFPQSVPPASPSSVTPESGVKTTAFGSEDVKQNDNVFGSVKLRRIMGSKKCDKDQL
ncbi:brain-specific angiogenesis inhibitor 1-associated protein 2-like, partial [Limulus polyphemus]|uniref:Brain-specific angiogenesis inhibitor 1-associated protein 2-like n=1 Tax=Limulus polyphemus TaxID=6850 RepID=A0ABM1BTZ6_LIMPO